MLLEKHIQITIFRIDNTHFEPIGDLSQYTSLIWPDAFNGYANFELWAPIMDANSELIKKGNVICFVYINNNPLFVIGPQFYYPIILVLLNNSIFLLFIKFIYIRIKHFLIIASFSLLIIVDITQIYTVFINPGIPKKVWFLSDEIINIIIKDENIYKEFNLKDYKICRKCNLLIYKCLKIIHCDICNVCCEYYDHHCPWIGKCIGRNNYLSFKAFLFSNILYFILQIVILFIYLYN